MILLSVYRFVFLVGLICYLYHGCIGLARTPTVRDNQLDSIGVWIYPCLIVECLHVASLLLLELDILADSLPIENVLAIHMLLLVFILVKS